jgi:hypothetical protein
LSALLATSLARFATAQTGPAQAEPAKAAAPQGAEAPAAAQPVEQVSTLRERLNRQLVEGCQRDLAARTRGQPATKGELLPDDQAAFLPLPKTSFEARRITAATGWR